MSWHFSDVHSIETVTELFGHHPQCMNLGNCGISQDLVEFPDVFADGVRPQRVVFSWFPGLSCLQVV